jgi:ABC-type sugar transport system substrate-binding protein
MQAACDDLGMNLKVVYVDRNPFMMLDDFTKLAGSSNKPDAVVFQNLKTIAVKMLEVAEKYKIPAFIFNAGLTEEQTAKYGGPREYFKYWIGQILPDDQKAGYDLAMKLFNEAIQLKLTDGQGKVHFIGINGTESDGAAIERSKGLVLAAKNEPRIVLHQNASGFWDRDKGKATFLGLLTRYPETKVIWAANDPMGLGVIDGIIENKKQPGKDFIVGSIDWIPEAQQQVQKGQLVTTIGGHFMETGWLVVLLYDYFQKKDFALEAVSYKSTMGSLSKTNIEAYLKYFKTENFYKIDFTQFSKAKHPEVKQYNFLFDKVLKNLSE